MCKYLFLSSDGKTVLSTVVPFTPKRLIVYCLLSSNVPLASLFKKFYISGLAILIGRIIWYISCPYSSLMHSIISFSITINVPILRQMLRSSRPSSAGSSASGKYFIKFRFGYIMVSSSSHFFSYRGSLGNVIFFIRIIHPVIFIINVTPFMVRSKIFPFPQES